MDVLHDIDKAPQTDSFSSRRTGIDGYFPEPLKLCDIITRYPVASFLVVSLAHVIIFATTIGLVFSGQNVFPLVFNELPLYIYNDARLKELSWRSKKEYDGFVYRPVQGRNIPSGFRGYVKDTVELIYEKPGENILDQFYLSRIKSAENRVFHNSVYQDRFCTLDHSKECVKPQSILRLFDGTFSHVDSVFMDANFSHIDTVVYTAALYNETREFLYLFIEKDGTINPNQIRTSITRSFFLMGWPFGGTALDLEKFLVDIIKPEIENIRDDYFINQIEVYYLNKLLLQHDLVEQALSDIKLAIGSFVFIFVFMCFQTGSIFITSFGIGSILSSFLLTNLIYRYMFQYIYFGFFHVIAIFLILGIGADDLFVFYDTWRLTGRNKYPSDAHRLSECYRKAAKTTFVTSCTTMMAFLVSGLSPLLPVKTFGIFAGVLVIINYLFVIIYFPTIIVLHHKKIKPVLCKCLAKHELSTKRRCGVVSVAKTGINRPRVWVVSRNQGDYGMPSSTKSRTGNVHTPTSYQYPSNKSAIKGNKTNEDDEEINEYLDLNIKIRTEFESHTRSVREPIPDYDQDFSSQNAETFKSKTKMPKKTFECRNRIVKSLKNGLYYFITLRVVKFVFPLLLLAVSAFFLHRSTMIEPDTFQLRLFRDDHNYAKASSKHYFSFNRNNDDEYQRLYLVWGMLPADISDCNQKSAEFCPGRPAWDELFDMNTPASQIAFKELCNRLENLPTSTADKLRIRRDGNSGKLQIACFTRTFEEFFERKLTAKKSNGDRKYPSTLSLSLPVTSANVTVLMNSHPSIYNNTLSNGFYSYFEILVSFWLTNGYTTFATDDFVVYNELLAERTVDGMTKGAYFPSSGLYYGTRLRYLAVEVNTSMNVYSLGYKEGMPVYQQWENFIKEINDDMPIPLKGGIQVTNDLWHWLHVQENIANSAINGILIGLFSSWLILIFTTMNYIIGTAAVLTIGLVTACVVGMIPLVGWKLGVLESINLCMVVGLSVDYIVHLAEAYIMSSSTKRLNRVHDMLESIGLSVISGAVTTMGAASFMLFAKIQFFYQFGIFILSTVGISIVFSLLGFSTVLAFCGPEGDTGSVKILATKMFKMFSSNTRDKVNRPVKTRATRINSNSSLYHPTQNRKCTHSQDIFH